MSSLSDIIQPNHVFGSNSPAATSEEQTSAAPSSSQSQSAASTGFSFGIIPAYSSPFSAVSGIPFDSSNSFPSSFSSPFIPNPTIVAPTKSSFAPHRIKSSPHNLQLAQLWPDDTLTQSLLTAVIDIAAEEKSEIVLTTPATIALAGCAFTLGHHLINTAVESASLIDAGNQPINLADVFGNIRTTTLSRLPQGWTAACDFPHVILDGWWQQAKQRLASRQVKQTFPAELDNETEQAVCGAIVTQWLRLLLAEMRSTATQRNSSFLSVGMLDVAMMFPASGVAAVYSALKCTSSPDLDALSSGKLGQSATSFDSGFKFGFTIPDATEMQYMSRSVEGTAIRRILDRDNWYHHPHLLRRVAEEFVRGDRIKHVSDKLLQDLQVQIHRFEIAPLLQQRNNNMQYGFSNGSFGFGVGNNSNLFSVGNYSNSGFGLGSRDLPEKCNQVHLAATDAKGKRWNFILEQESPSRCKLVTANQIHPPHATIIEGEFGGQTQVYSSRESSDFEPHLSAGQQQVLDLMQQAVLLNRFIWTSDSGEGKLDLKQLGLLSQKSPSAFGAAASETTYRPSFESVRSFGNTMHLDQFKAQCIREWRAHAFEQIAVLAYPFLDYERWGSGRFTEMQPDGSHRKFQSYVIDAVMQSSGMQLLPTVLLDLIADYYTMDSLPYLSVEEQQVFVTAATSSDEKPSEK